MSLSEKYRERAVAIEKQMRGRSRRDNLLLAKKKRALQALAENEDWLEGKISPLPQVIKPVPVRISILKLVNEEPGLTESEIVKRLAAWCHAANHVTPLVKEGILSRKGKGGPHDPYRYFAE